MPKNRYVLIPYKLTVYQVAVHVAVLIAVYLYSKIFNTKFELQLEPQHGLQDSVSFTYTKVKDK